MSKRLKSCKLLSHTINATVSTCAREKHLNVWFLDTFPFVCGNMSKCYFYL